MPPGLRIIAAGAAAYGVATGRWTPVSSNLPQAIRDAVAERSPSEAPSAFLWNDIVPVLGRRLRWEYQQLLWPSNDTLLAGQVDVSGRCAVRTDVLDRLCGEGVIARRDDTTGALAALLRHRPAEVVELDGVHRFVAAQRGPLYRSADPPRPPGRAGSISVIVSYRDRPELMQACLASLAGQRTAAPVDLVLVDNQSAPENRDRVEEMAAGLPAALTVRHVRYDAPYNHSVQTALGVASAAGEVLVMLNNDARLLDDTLLQTVADWSMTPGVATAGPRLVGRGGRLVSAGVQACPAEEGRPAIIRESEVMALSRTIRFSAGASFACAAMRRDVWDELGGCDAVAFPTQRNDSDFDLRALDAGYRHLYVGTVEAYHEPGGSGRNTSEVLKPIEDRLRQRHPDIGRYRRLDPALVRLPGRPHFDDPWARTLLAVNTAWRKTLKAAMTRTGRS